MKTICPQCSKFKGTVFNRTLLKNLVLFLCEQCYKRCLDTCSLCKRKKIAYTFSSQNKPICKKCYLEAPRRCKVCNSLFPSGRGRICYECSCFNRLSKKLHILNLLLSNYTNSLFEEFTWWLKKRKGIEYTCNFIQRHFIFFYKIDTLANKINKFPSYEDLLSYFKVSETRSFLLVMRFLENRKIIKSEDKIKNIYSNLNQISSLLNHFNKNTNEYNIINQYHNLLINKLELNQTTIRSIRLALTPAVKVLDYKQYFKNLKINDNIVSSYLWIYPGQKNALTGFLNFLNKEFNYNLLSVKNMNHKLKRTRSKKNHLKHRLIKLLNKEVLSINEKRRILNISIEYFHRIKVPSNVFLSKQNIFKSKGNYYINCCRNKFYIHEILIDKYLAQIT